MKSLKNGKKHKHCGHKLVQFDILNNLAIHEIFINCKKELNLRINGINYNN